MPVLDVEKCKSVLFVKKSIVEKGYLLLTINFLKENTMMLFEKVTDRGLLLAIHLKMPKNRCFNSS